jgi:hypothetical protein
MSRGGCGKSDLCLLDLNNPEVLISNTDYCSHSFTSFYINLPIGGVAALTFFALFQKPRTPLPQATTKEKLLQLDLLGTMLAVASIVCYFLALEWGGVSKSWGDPDVVGTLVGSVLLAIAFGVSQWYLDQRASIIPRILAQRHVAGGSAFMFL